MVKDAIAVLCCAVVVCRLLGVEGMVAAVMGVKRLRCSTIATLAAGSPPPVLLVRCNRE